MEKGITNLNRRQQRNFHNSDSTGEGSERVFHNSPSIPVIGECRSNLDSPQ